MTRRKEETAIQDDIPPHPCFGWQVIELLGGAHHLICCENVSAEIVKWNYPEAACQKADGKVYLLGGQPGAGAENRFVLPNWLKWHGITQWRDVSTDVFAAIGGVRRPRPYLHEEYGRNPNYPRF